MKGLLIKDLCLLKNQKRLLPVFALLAVWFTVLHTDGFAFPFLGMMSTILTASTVSYDELDRCQTALFTLPFERRTYVAEKYVLGAILLAAAMALGGLCTAARQIVAHDVELKGVGLTVVLTVCVCAVALGAIIPLRIRFGGDQGRIVLYTVFALVALAVVGLTRLLPKQTGELSGKLLGLPAGALVALLALLAVAVLLIGYALGVRWIKAKEF